MRICIVYASKTGNTESLAREAENMLASLDHEVSIFPVEEYDLAGEQEYDLMLVGSYCDSNALARPVLDLLEATCRNKRVACFVTHATAGDGPYYDRWAAGCEADFKAFCLDKDVSFSRYFHCRAKPSKSIAFFMRMVVIRDREKWKEYREQMNDHPNQQDLERFREFILGAIRECPMGD